MRERKFRAYSRVEEKMFPVESIDFTNTLLTMNAGDNSITEFIDDVELMEYTGFDDAGSVDLYEDDIIEEDGRFYIIEWDESMGMFQCTDIKTLDNIALHEFDGVKTVWLQGNKHDNPEFLK